MMRSTFEIDQVINFIVSIAKTPHKPVARPIGAESLGETQLFGRATDGRVTRRSR